MGAASLLLAAMMVLHHELVVPYLPGGQAGDKGNSFTWYGILAAVGMGLQGLFVSDVMWSAHVILHYMGHALFLVGSWGASTTAGPLYMPASYFPAEFSFNWLAARQQHVEDVTAAASSRLLQLPHEGMLISLRHNIIVPMPLICFVLPLFFWVRERRRSAKVKGTDNATPQMRDIMGCAQWLMALSIAVFFISFGPELAIAAYLPVYVAPEN